MSDVDTLQKRENYRKEQIERWKSDEIKALTIERDHWKAESERHEAGFEIIGEHNEELRSERDLLKKAFKKLRDKSTYCDITCYHIKPHPKCGSDECIELHLQKAREGE